MANRRVFLIAEFDGRADAISAPLYAKNIERRLSEETHLVKASFTGFDTLAAMTEWNNRPQTQTFTVTIQESGEASATDMKNILSRSYRGVSVVRK